MRIGVNYKVTMRHVAANSNALRGNRRAMWRFNKTTRQRGRQEETT
jgi:hypothetical protein